MKGGSETASACPSLSKARRASLMIAVGATFRNDCAILFADDRHLQRSIVCVCQSSDNSGEAASNFVGSRKKAPAWPRHSSWRSRDSFPRL